VHTAKFLTTLLLVTCGGSYWLRGYAIFALPFRIIDGFDTLEQLEIDTSAIKQVWAELKRLFTGSSHPSLISAATTSDTDPTVNIPEEDDVVISNDLLMADGVGQKASSVVDQSEDGGGTSSRDPAVALADSTTVANHNEDDGNTPFAGSITDGSDDSANSSTSESLETAPSNTAGEAFPAGK